MRNHVACSLALVASLTGCDVSMISSAQPKAERVVRSAVKTTQTLVRTQKASDRQGGATDAGSAAKAQSTAGAQSAATAASQAAEDAVADATASAGATTGLASFLPAGAATAAARIVPIMDDDWIVTRLKFVGDTSTLSWTVDTTPGSAIPVANIRMVLQTTSYYPLPDDFVFSEEAASEEAASEAIPLPQTGLIEEDGTPTTLEKAPADFSWPAAFIGDSSTPVTYDLDNQDVLRFLDENPGTATFKLEATLLDAQGNALKDERDRPFTLKHTIQVL